VIYLHAGIYEHELPEILFKRIDEIDWPHSRARIRGLKDEGIETIHDLVQKTEAELLRVPNIGRRSLSAITSKLTEMGVHLADIRYQRP
jgi:DNA-directed RNA polymerase subunit alpha